MGYSVNDSHVHGMLFNERGGWEYSVCLDYTGQTQSQYENWDNGREAVKALARATEKGISGVTFKVLPEGWSLVVPEPHARDALPLLVRGGFAGLADMVGGARGARSA